MDVHGRALRCDLGSELLLLHPMHACCDVASAVDTRHDCNLREKGFIINDVKVQSFQFNNLRSKDMMDDKTTDSQVSLLPSCLIMIEPGKYEIWK